MMDLAVAYYTGKGIPPDSAIAYAWYHVSATYGTKDAFKTKTALYEKLTPEDRKRATVLSSEYENKYGPYAK